jgi:hypothetical protein
VQQQKQPRNRDPSLKVNAWPSRLQFMQRFDDLGDANRSASIGNDLTLVDSALSAPAIERTRSPRHVNEIDNDLRPDVCGYALRAGNCVDEGP